MNLKEYIMVTNEIIPIKTDQLISEIEILFYNLFDNLKEIRELKEMILQRELISNSNHKLLEKLQNILNVKKLEAQKTIFKIMEYKKYLPLQFNLIGNSEQLTAEKYFAQETFQSKLIMKNIEHVLNKSQKIEQLIELISEKCLDCDEDLELTMYYKLSKFYENFSINLKYYLSSINYTLNKECLNDNFGILNELDNYYIDEMINIGYLATIINSSSINSQESKELIQLIEIYSQYLEQKNLKKSAQR